ncbi:MAG: 1-aminocyclopropane-1-carboxylate deaminase/D-cysteine desulfhydrase [Flavobacteriales bacterium]|jgi:1-aminocyclopropane-1-carboxylate deaminase
MLIFAAMEYSQWASSPAIFVKHCERNHPIVSGNKWYKLKYNIEMAQKKGLGLIITFGGAWSNHIHATAFYAKGQGLKSTGIIRGERPAELSATLRDAEEWGMQLEFVTREAYREKHTEDFKMWLLAEYGPAHIIPEGGANYLGVNGCMEMLDDADDAYDVICCAGGTGTMAAGLALRLKPHQKLMVFSSLKGGFMRDQVQNQLLYFLMDQEATDEVMSAMRFIDDYHFGGYARHTPELVDFIFKKKEEKGWWLDQVYTAKMMWGIDDLVKKGFFNTNQKILAIHSGGLQGLRSLGINGA